MMRISRENLTQLFDVLAARGALYLPIRDDDITNFGRYAEGAEVDLDTLKAANTPKDMFLPQVEDLFSATSRGGKIAINPAPLAALPFVIFGVRACDAAALEVLDSVYLKEPIDRFYEARRNAGCVVTLSCAKPRPTCFCAAFGIDASVPGGDVTTWLDDDYLHWQAQTPKGEALTADLADLFEPADECAISAQKDDIRRQTTALPYSALPLDKFDPAKMVAIFNSSFWDDAYTPCVACGTCTFICPTCQCYDIRDFSDGINTIRYRCWDSCMYSDFTQMAHGNPRTTQKERFRQRFMHKLVYHPQNNDGQFGCTGCGRCVNRCPGALSILKIIKGLEVAADV